MTRRNWKRVLSAWLLLLATLTAFRSSAEEESDPWANVEEMVVTGSGIGLNIQATPDSVLAFGALELEAAQITDIAGLADYTPNLEIKTGASSVSSPTIFIRGIGLLDFNSNAASSVAIYNDNVYMNSPLGQLFQFYDVQAVEVRRGPQGSLYARNATAGAIRVIPNRPDDSFGATTQFSYGNYKAIEVRGTLNVPIVPELLAVRVAGQYSKRDGYTENRCGGQSNRSRLPLGFLVENQCRSRTPNSPTSGLLPINVPDEVNETDNWAARILLKLTPTDGQEWVLNINGGQSKANAYQFQSRGVRGPRGTNVHGYADADGDPFAGDYDLVEPEDLDLIGAVLNGTIQAGENHVLHTTTGFQRAERTATRNIDGSPTITAHTRNEDEVFQVSEEARLESEYGGRLEWELGAYALYEELDSRLIIGDLVPGDPIPGPLVSNIDRRVDQDIFTWAAWLRGQYEITEWLKLEGGIRYNWQRTQFNIDLEAATPLLESDEQIWGEPTGEVVLTWLPTEFLSIYGRYTHGFKSGHYNAGIITGIQDLDVVDPETVNAYEVGLKSEWLDGQLVVNAAVWYYDYRDYQVFQLTDSQQAVPLPELVNAPLLESYGLELDIQTQPIEAMRFDVSLAVLKATFRDFSVQRVQLQSPLQTRPVTKNFSGNPLVAAPEISVTMVVSYDLDFGRLGILTPRLDTSYRGKTYFSPGISSATDSSARPIKNEGASQDPYWLLNARLGWRTTDGQIGIAGWVRNLTNEVYLANSLDATSGLSSYLDVYGLPRTYGVTINLQF